jgi:hypothetical protein
MAAADGPLNGVKSCVAFGRPEGVTPFPARGRGSGECKHDVERRLIAPSPTVSAWLAFSAAEGPRDAEQSVCEGREPSLASSSNIR